MASSLTPADTLGTQAAPPGDVDSILEIKNLHTYFFLEKGTVKAVNGVDLTLQRQSTLGIVGESGCGKSITAMSVMRLIKSPPGKHRRGRDPAASRRQHAPVDIAQPGSTGRRDARHPRRGDRHHLSGADDLAQPAAQCRQPDQPKSVKLHQKRGRHRGQAARAGDAREGTDQRAQAAAEPVSPPTQRRHAPARHDRHGALVQPVDPDCRRADHRPGCDRAGADPGADADAQARLSARRSC